MERLKRSIGKALYGFLFLAVLPAALMAWAIAARNVIHIPTLQSTLWGTVLAAAGLGIMIWGMLSLWIFGGGLPMNAFPSQRFVGRGAYALIPHPIYGGFIFICGGVSIYFGSASGLWLVTPAVALGCAALVLGYELPDLRRRLDGRLRRARWRMTHWRRRRRSACALQSRCWHRGWSHTA